MSAKSLSDLSGEIAAKTKSLQDLYATPQDPMTGARPAGWTENVDAAMKEIESLRAERAPLVESERAKAHEAEVTAKAEAMISWLNDVDPAARADFERTLEGRKETEQANKSHADQFIENDAVKAFVERGGGDTGWVTTKGDLPTKALFDTNQFAPFSPRIPRIVPIIHRPMQLLDRIRQVPYPGIQIVRWMEETVWTLPPNRGATAEGAPYQEGALTYTERTATMAKKTYYIPVTEEIELFSNEVYSMMSSRVPTGLGLRIDEGIVNDPGPGPRGTAQNNLNGLLNMTERTTRNKQADESFYEAIVRMMNNVKNVQYSMPDMIIMNGNDYTDFMLTQDAELRYLFGLMSERRPSPWGIPVVEANQVPEGTVIVGDFGQFFEIRDAQMMRTRVAPRNAVSATVAVSVDTTDGSASARPGTGSFTAYEAPAGQLMIFSEVFLQTVCYRPQAFVTGTGF